MSYILDALRKADAERERDPARGIHAQPMPGMGQAAGGRRPTAVLALGALVLASAAVYVFWQRQPAPVAPVFAPSPAPVAALASPPVLVTPAPVPMFGSTGLAIRWARQTAVA